MTTARFGNISFLGRQYHENRLAVASIRLVDGGAHPATIKPLINQSRGNEVVLPSSSATAVAVMRVCSGFRLSFHCPGGQATDDLTLENHDQHEQWRCGRNNRCDCGHFNAVLLSSTQVAVDGRDHC